MMISRFSRKGAFGQLLTLLALPALVGASSSDFELVPFPVEVHPSGADEFASALSIIDAASVGFAASETRDLFLSVPGAHLDQAGGPGGRSTLFLRGAEENHSLLFLDGVPLNDPTNTRGGAVDLSLLSAGVVQQMAVVRGPASVRYGPEALAGVVHLETGRRGVPERTLMGGIGGQDYHRLQLRWSKPVAARTDLGLIASTDADGLRSDGGCHQRKFVRGAFGWEGPIQIDVSAWYAELDAWSFPDDSGGHRYAVVRELEERRQEALAGSVRVAREVGDLRIVLLADGAAFDNRIDSPGVSPGARDPMGLPASIEESRFQRARVQLLLEHVVGSLEWSGGIDAQHEDGRSAGSLFFGPMELPTDFRFERDRYGAFGELSALLPAGMRMTLGARADKFTDEAWRATVRAGLRGPIGPATEWRINAGNAFKVPSFYALANPLVGNPMLRPETSETIDAGWRHTLHERGDFIELTVFASRSSDGIDFDPGPPPALVNRDNIRRDGVELGLGWRPYETLSLAGSLSYVNARIKGSEDRLRGRPNWRGGLRADWLPVPRLRTSLALVTVGSIHDTSVPTGDVSLRSWVRLDVSIEWSLNRHVDLLVAIDNLLDREFEEMVGFVSRDRRARLGLLANF